MSSYDNFSSKYFVALRTRTYHSRFALLLTKMGFEEWIRGSHHMFRKTGIVEKINLQREGSKAKIYQVRQVRAVILKYKLGGKVQCTNTRSLSTGATRMRPILLRFPSCRAAWPMA